MKLDELAFLMGKTKLEVEEILKQNGVIELRLTEKSHKEIKDSGTIKILE